MISTTSLVEHRGCVVHVAADDPVWVGAIKRAHTRWRLAGLAKPRLVWSSAADAWTAIGDQDSSRLLVVEVGRRQLTSTAHWLSAGTRQRNLRVAILLGRAATSGFVSAVDRQLAATLLHEAGASLTLASPRQLPALFDLAAQVFRQTGTIECDPLDELPLGCWGPGWQSGHDGDRV